MCNIVAIPSNTTLSNFCVNPKPCTIQSESLLVK